MNILAEDIFGAVRAVTKEWTKQRKAEERGSKTRHSRADAFAGRVNCTDVAAAILPGGYGHASGDGKNTVSKRHFYYAVREEFRKKTGRPLGWGYFADTLLVQYMNRHPEETRGWKVTADPRGNLTIPNAGREVRIPVGTIQIDNHLLSSSSPSDPFDIPASVSIQWPSLAAGQRYQAVLYIEKEGFDPMLEEARIAERFDVAIVSCKGQSVSAARKYVDQVCAEGNGVPLFVVHDFDKFGFEISERLTSVSDWAEENDRVTYRFRNEIDVTDFGLRLDDVKRYGLTGEVCQFKGHFGSGSIATKEEQVYLRSGRRVELNELTAPQFLGWLEGKLAEHLPDRLVPDDDVLEDAYRRALAVAEINGAIGKIRSRAIKRSQAAKLPASLRERLEGALKGSAHAWDRVLYELVEEGELS